MTEWLIANWQWVLAALYVAEKVVKLTPWKYDDIVIDIIWGALRKLTGKEK